MADITRDVLLRILVESKQAVADLRKLANEAANATAAQRENNTAARQESRTNTQRRRSIQDLAAGLFVLRSAYSAVTGAVRQLQATSQQAFNFLIRGNEELQKSAVGTAAAIASSNDVIDENGQVITDTAEAISRLVPALQDAREQVVQLAADIPGITENDIQPVFENLAGSVGELGLTIEELPELAASTAAAFQVLNVPLFQARQEIQSLIRGEVNRNTEIANRLGLQAEDLRQAKERGELGEFLSEQFAAAAEGAGLLADLSENATSNLQTLVQRVGRRLGAPLVAPVQQALAAFVEFLAENEDRVVGFFEPIIQGALAAARAAVRFGQQFLDATAPARETFAGLFQALVEFGKTLASTGIVDFFIDLFQVLQQQVVVGLQRAAQFFTVILDVGRSFLPILRTQIRLFEQLIDLISFGELSLQRFNREIRELNDANEVLSESVTKLGNNIALTNEEFAELEKSLQRALGPQAQEQIDKFRERNEQLLAVSEAQTEELQSRRQAQEDLERSERLQFQNRQNRLNIEADLLRDELQDLEQISDLVQEITDDEVQQLEVLEAAISLEQQRSQRTIEVLEEERDRLQAIDDLLQDQGASSAQRRRNAERLRDVEQDIADEQIRAVEQQQFLQDQQNAAKAAEIEAQRQLNQLKIDQLEIENQLSQIQLQQQAAEIQDSISRAAEEGLEPAEVSALEDRLRGLNESIQRAQTAEERLGARRAAIDRSAASQQTALGLTAQAGQEAFLDRIGELLVQRGDREAERIAGSRRLDPLERADRLRDLAAERTGVTLQTPNISVEGAQGAAPMVQVETPSQPVQETNQPVIERLDAILAKIPTDRDVGVTVAQSVSTGVVNTPPVTENGLDFTTGNNVAATGG